MNSGCLKRGLIQFNNSLSTISYDEMEIDFPADKGLRDIARLLTTPHRQYSVIDLGNEFKSHHEYNSGRSQIVCDDDAETGFNMVDLGFGEAIWDKQALSEIKDRITILRNKIEDKEEIGADSSAESEELVDYLKHLKATTGLKGRSRRWITPKEKFRKMVSIRIARTIQKLYSHHPTLATHLKRSIKLGNDPAYRPEEQIEWRVSEKL